MKSMLQFFFFGSLFFACAKDKLVITKGQSTTVEEVKVQGGTSIAIATATPTPTPTPTPVPVAVTPAPILPFITIDDDFRTSIKPLWNLCLKEDFSDTRNVEVFVATNRKKKGKSFGCSDDQFGVELDTNTEYGLCKINVPKNHVIGDITMAKNNRQSSHDFFKVLGAKALGWNNLIDQIKKTKRIPLIFVHGFNVRFQEAVLRSAQIAYDLKYQGPIVLFTWPAGAGDGFFDENLLNRVYEQNAKTAQASVEPFKKFLTELKNAGLKINLAVHSMGHQVVLPALKSLGDKADSVFINELILNAPDFEAQEFTDLTDVIKNISNRITLYCSFNDKAMIASKSVNKNERLGACTYSENVDSINVSLIDGDTFALGHGYYSSRAILNDVFQVLLGLDAEKRLFIKKSEPNSTEKYFLRP